ncbi:hypothetical protein GYMLUDRAFT_244857 [Collybiopsis luxurians FD-317 M1]|uniref:Uncharacterized protein n=1 Tax=Collybiopsis luxurians FD-317 M1 TaxID=944289 RepID=A0A0D0CVP1_9AGAR|nr:hypothetical protein GYMLUDRAFT_244857 [Collybiopsis luxurians FD-317 M1]
MSTTVHSTNSNFIARLWCRIYTNLARLTSILSTIIITLWPHTRTPMLHRKRAAPCRSVSLSSLASANTIESSTSTLVEELVIRNDQATPIPPKNRTLHSPPRNQSPIQNPISPNTSLRHLSL